MAARRPAFGRRPTCPSLRVRSIVSRRQRLIYFGCVRPGSRWDRRLCLGMRPGSEVLRFPQAIGRECDSFADPHSCVFGFLLLLGGRRPRLELYAASSARAFFLARVLALASSPGRDAAKARVEVSNLPVFVGNFGGWDCSVAVWSPLARRGCTRRFSPCALALVLPSARFPGHGPAQGPRSKTPLRQFSVSFWRPIRWLP